MSTITIALWAVIVAVTVLFVIIAIKSKSQTANTMESHYKGDRSLSPFVTMMSMGATLMSAFIFVGLSGFFYTHGIGSWVYVGWSNSAMFLLTIVFGYRMWRLSHKFGYTTPLQFMSDRYQCKWVGAICAIITIIFTIPYLSLQMVGVAKLLTALSGGQISYLAGVIIISILGFIIVQFGGMRTVARTDMIQGCFMFTIGIIIVVVILGKEFGGSIANLFARVNEVEPSLLSIPGPNGFFTMGMLFSCTLASFFMPVSQIQISSRYLTLKNKKAWRTMMIGTAIIPLISIPASMLIGLGAKAVFPALASGDDSFMAMISTYLPLPLMLCAVLAVFSASLTTLDSMVLGLGAVLGGDLLPALKVDEKKHLAISKYGAIVLLLVTMFFAFNPPDLIVMLALVSYTATLQFVPAFLGAMFWKRATKQGAIASIIAGMAVFLGTKYIPGLAITWGSFDPSFWGFVAACIVYVIVCLCTKPDLETYDRLLGYLKNVYPFNKQNVEAGIDSEADELVVE